MENQSETQFAYYVSDSHGRFSMEEYASFDDAKRALESIGFVVDEKPGDGEVSVRGRDGRMVDVATTLWLAHIADRPDMTGFIERIERGSL